jgi:betaine-aldehyde dehydrogenase
VFVHADIVDRFTDALLDIVQKLRVGDPLDPENDMGPLTFQGHYERVLGYIATGQREGAELLTGGRTARDQGYFVDPTVFRGVEQGMTIATDEIFGPVVSILSWTDLDEVVAAANDTVFGLTANIWTDNVNVAHSTAHRIQAGYVWINGTGSRVPGTPFGGFKQSGLGRESSLDEVFEFSQYKTIAVEIHP